MSTTTKREDFEDFPVSRVAPGIGNESLVVDSQNQQTGNTMPTATGETSDDVVPAEIPDRPRGVDASGGKVGFIDQVKGFAKLDAGKVFNNEKEVKLGEAKVRGEDV